MVVIFLVPTTALANRGIYSYNDMPKEIVNQWATAKDIVTISFSKQGGLDNVTAINDIFAQMKNDPAVWANIKSPTFTFKSIGNNVYEMVVETEYYHDANALLGIEKFAKDWVKQHIKEDMGEFQKAKTIFDFMKKNYKYSYSDQMIIKGYSKYSPLSLIHNKEGVCNAFAGLFMALAKESNLECVYIVSNPDSDGITHGWNLVKIGEKWYHVDLTWAVEFGARGNMFFLRGDSFIKDYRTWNYDKFPAATDDYKE